MAAPITILAISSSVAAGHVGLSAIIPTLNALKLQAVALPTTILSNHPGFRHFAGLRIEPDVLMAMLDALAANAMLDAIDTILTGYLPTPAHVTIAETAIDRVRSLNPDALYICDPILGDDPKGLYIAEDAAFALRDQLVPRADIVLPNRFELSWLSGQEIARAAEPVEAAIIAAHSLPAPRVIAKSIPISSDHLANLDITATSADVFTIAKRQRVPQGTGDVLSALIAARQPLGLATAALQILIDQSIGAEHLQIVPAAPSWQNATALHATPHTAHPICRAPQDQTGTETIYAAGADACPGGWISVMYPVGQPHRATSHVYETFAALLAATAHCAAVAIDIPIGIPETATAGGRLADRAARAVLGARKSSVFAVPARAAVACSDYREACVAAFAHSDPPRKVAKQTFHIFPKIREVDALMSPALQHRIVECHPEVAFWAMNDRQPLSEPKKVKSSPYGPGLDLRRQLLIRHGYTAAFLNGPNCPRKVAAPDDFLDACATAWTANRMATSQSDRFPDRPDYDPRHLRMEIVF